MSAQPTTAAAVPVRQPRQLHLMPPAPRERGTPPGSTRPVPAVPATVPTVPAPVRRAPAPTRRGLAPVSRTQAWRRRVGAVSLAVLVAVLVVGVVVVGLLGAAPARVVAPGPEPALVTGSTVVVAPGETLWDVARDNAPRGTSTAAYVDALRAANALDGTSLGAWQVLRLPGS